MNKLTDEELDQIANQVYDEVSIDGSDLNTVLSIALRATKEFIKKYQDAVEE